MIKQQKNKNQPVQNIFNICKYTCLFIFILNSEIWLFCIFKITPSY